MFRGVQALAHMIWLGYGSREKCAELDRMCGTMLDLWDCVGLRTPHEYMCPSCNAA